jgi:hypothetical protein
MKYWEITPHEDSSYDFCLMPANTEEQHRAALEYAQARLESGWDGLEVGQEITVTIKLCEGIDEEVKLLFEEVEE